MLPNFKRSETEPPKVSPSFTPASAPPTPGASARSLGLARPSERNAPSVIGPDLTINGNLVSKGEVQIDGEIQGDIQGTYVVIGEKARITGGIVAEEIVVRGHVMGSVRGKRVMLQSSSHVEGDIFHQALAIEQGAFFEGKSRRSDDPTADAQKPDIPSLNGTGNLG
ncbi:MAG: polymer-forming cytoskeletal protein [Hyphomicrobium sp.]|uniref:bactofilin family protein n=1 Tax=Hyphomicrobium sp. TaxID=82 RepID=UPI00132AC8D3|nr:polymer-forming cytoskeletal protein [Hyphomicrobium sp.]KAB2938117.1 MAG: polymer-forming cytoskeletal protein [Hyphomicrobium sp.]MBZ0210505.1 polymer-forming cytoskeletal protein [Hyphomicrobium sp.]